MTEFVTIDRFEGDWAVLERADLSTVAVTRSQLPAEAREGEVLRLNPDGSFEMDTEETQRRRERILHLQNSLFDE